MSGDDKKELVGMVLEAFNRRNLEEFISHMTDDINFVWHGSTKIGPGKEAVRDFFKFCPEIIDFKMEHIIGENNIVTANGTVTTRHEDGNS